MNENHYWNEFYLSGSILSYLSYKKCQLRKSAEQKEKIDINADKALADHTLLCARDIDGAL